MYIYIAYNGFFEYHTDGRTMKHFSFNLQYTFNNVEYSCKNEIEKKRSNTLFQQPLHVILYNSN